VLLLPPSMAAGWTGRRLVVSDAVLTMLPLVTDDAGATTMPALRAGVAVGKQRAAHSQLRSTILLLAGAPYRLRTLADALMRSVPGLAAAEHPRGK